MTRQTLLLYASAAIAASLMTGCKTSEGEMHAVSAGASVKINPPEIFAREGSMVELNAIVKGGSDKAELSYQWERNSTPIEGATGRTYVIDHASKRDVAFYTVTVTKSVGDDINKYAILQPVPMSLTTTNDRGPITIWGPLLPTGGGTSGGCPGKYVAYVNFTTTAAPYGWAPMGTSLKACDGTGSTITKIKAFGSTFGDTICGTACISWQNPKSSSYRFTIYFPAGAPQSNPYPISLTGF